jgi:hypothetical protein
LLKTHFLAPEHTITVSELAKAVDYENYNAVNLQYGTFADHICNALGRLGKPEVRLAILASTPNKGEEKEHWKLVMRPELVQALQGLGWFGKKS